MVFQLIYAKDSVLEGHEEWLLDLWTSPLFKSISLEGSTLYICTLSEGTQIFCIFCSEISNCYCLFESEMF